VQKLNIKMMADKTVDLSRVPEDVRLKLEELDIELAEGMSPSLGFLLFAVLSSSIMLLLVF
jgi:hypothetical protein